jgi:hypothetical protein
MKRRQNKPKLPAFDDWVQKHNADVAESIVFLESETGLVTLDRITLKLAYALNHNLIDLPDSKKGRAIRVLIAKIAHEAMAFSGGLRAGTLDGGWHHLRALIEVRAALLYLFADKAHTEVRLEQFLEYGDFMVWQKRKQLDDDLKNTRITPLGFDRQNTVSDALLATVTPQVIANWRRIWGKNDKELMKIRHWHRGTIKDLIDAVPSEHSLNREYEILCQGTHVSPVGHRLANDRGARTLGYEAKDAHSATRSMGLHLLKALRQIDLALDKKLMNHIRAELDAASRQREAAR